MGFPQRQPGRASPSVPQVGFEPTTSQAENLESLTTRPLGQEDRGGVLTRSQGILSKTDSPRVPLAYPIKFKEGRWRGLLPPSRYQTSLPISMNRHPLVCALRYCLSLPGSHTLAVSAWMLIVAEWTLSPKLVAGTILPHQPGHACPGSFFSTAYRI
jgi:hypothetical protein